MKFIDEDTGESRMDIVSVPEGLSIQMYMRNGIRMPEDYISVILKPNSIDNLIDFLQEYKYGEKRWR